jgi:ABC-2 type transport system permease protein
MNMAAALTHEWRLLVRSPMAVLAVVLLCGLSPLAVVSGMRETERQDNRIAQALQLQLDDSGQLAAHPSRSRDAGAAAYYGFHATWDPPAPGSFLALGLRDTSPHVLRVRALALQAQLHEGDTHNPELALLGRLDLAFVLVYLAPLFVIALLYDLVSAERAAGRLATLVALPGGNQGLWLRRAGLRCGLLFMALALPVVVGAGASGMPGMQLAWVLASMLVYLLCWAGLALRVATGPWASATNAFALVGCWAALTLVLPALVYLVITRANPAHQGAELMLAQREAVHGAWDQPREQTLQRFFQTHPEWRDTAPLPAGFHWKWYYAFQQLGDESVAGQATAYRAALLARQRWSTHAGWLLPPVALQTLLHRVAHSDLPAQLAYQDAIASFHGRLRRFFYPYLFTDKPFGPQDLHQVPRFVPAVPTDLVPVSPMLALLLAAALMACAGVRGVGRVQARAAATG